MSTAADRVLAHAVDAGDVPGVVALAADESGVIYAGAFGRRALDRGPAMTPDTVFAIASMTKPVTSVAALQLVEQGRVTLDEPLGERLPELAALRVLDGFDAAGAPRFRAPRRPITLRHLLTHTAGFAYPHWNADLLRYQQSSGAPIPFQQLPPVADAGERWEYGTNTNWVGLLVERLSGQSLEDYFRAHILDPLGMADTGHLLPPERRARLATCYQRRADGALTPIDGGGGLFSTGPDYLRFLRMFLGDGQVDDARLLRAGTVAMLAENQIGALDAGDLDTTMPDSSNDVRFFPGMVKRWGLAGLITTERAPTGRSAGSWAWAGLYNTYFWVDPTRHIAGLLLTQLLPFCDRAVLDLFAAFERAVYASRA